MDLLTLAEILDLIEEVRNLEPHLEGSLVGLAREVAEAQYALDQKAIEQATLKERVTVGQELQLWISKDTGNPYKFVDRVMLAIDKPLKGQALKEGE